MLLFLIVFYTVKPIILNFNDYSRVSKGTSFTIKYEYIEAKVLKYECVQFYGGHTACMSENDPSIV